MTNETLAAALGQADELGPVRCPEMARTERGWERCRRDADGHHRHHIRGRSWQTAGPMPRLDLGHSCTGECCRWPDQVTPYLGHSPRGGEIKVTKWPPAGAARK